MPYVNVGVTINGERPARKKALRDAMESDPDTVLFDNTAVELGADKRTHFRGDEVLTDLKDGTTLTVTGPDPYTDRKWYASVTVKNGRVVVS